LADVEAERRRLLEDQSVFGPGRGAKPVTVSRVARVGSQPAQWCRFLHTLVAFLAPATVVEMGTAVGMTAASMATALPADARMWTVDMRSGSAVHAAEIFRRVGVDVGVVTGTFEDVLTDVLRNAAPVDLLYVDGHHDGQATLQYTEQAAPFLSERAVVVYDDIRWSPDMRGAWEEIREQGRWRWSADLNMVGVCAAR
jgi:predicted O-methyltransferase YrrM